MTVCPKELSEMLARGLLQLGIKESPTLEAKMLRLTNPAPERRDNCLLNIRSTLLQLYQGLTCAAA
jgi:hypothetical protein